MIRILIADDHIVVRIGLRTLLESEPGLQVVAEAAGGAETVRRYGETHPDIVLLDLQMPDGGGLNTLRQIRSSDPAAQILILTSYGSEEDIYQSIQLGAAGYILKTEPSADLIEAVRTVGSGGSWLSPSIELRLRERTGRLELTTRESEVLKLVFEGLANKEIAYRLGVADNTIKNHINSLMTKLGADDRTHAVHLALKRGLIHLD
jgi:two-component system NarL family response regulator